MSKEGEDPQKKLKTADLPTSSSSNKISYGSLKSNSTSSSISYASLRKQQVSNLKPISSSQIQKQPLPNYVQSASLASLQAATKPAIPVTTTKQVESQSKEKEVTSKAQEENISLSQKNSAAPKPQSTEQAAATVQSSNSHFSTGSSQGFTDAPLNQAAPPGQVNMKSQKMQIIERAKKLKEEEARLKALKQQAAKKQAEQGKLLGSSGVTSQQQIQQQQKAKELAKAKEKKPLTEYEAQIEQLKKYQLQKEHENKKIEKIKRMAIEGKIVIGEYMRQLDHEIKVDEKEKEVFQNERGDLVDSKNNIIAPEPIKSHIKGNQQKKQEEKLRKMMRNARIQNAQIFQDSGLFMTTSIKRDRKKVHALNFIEDTKEVEKKKDTIMEEEFEDDEDDSNSQINEDKISEESESEGEEEVEKNEDFKQLIQKTEVDYKREEFQKSTSKYLQLLHKKKQSLKQKHHDPIPDIEWWDTPLFDNFRRYYLPLEQEAVASVSAGEEQQNENNLSINILDNLEIVKNQLVKLQDTSFSYSAETYKKEKISNLIEHPKPFKNEGLPNMNQIVVIPNYMTEQERKKLRRRHRFDKERERQDKVKLGLLPPPPPKVKLKNMMRVLGNEAIADPTKMEQLVRNGIEERLQEHLKRNEERKLTKEQKADKYIRKLKRDSSIECRVALFRIENLGDRVHKFKVDINAQQMSLHGLLINPVVSAEARVDNNFPAIVLVEGGPKSIKSYKKLLLRRIKWTKNSYVPKDENGNPLPVYDLSQNKCALVWEGVVKDHSFNKWKVIETDNEVEAKRAFSEKSVEFYFDMAINYSYPE